MSEWVAHVEDMYFNSCHLTLDKPFKSLKYPGFSIKLARYGNPVTL